ncbi:5'-AMP-activated protein kinase subunit beta-2-like isoform X2 [Lineus longissimus]|uniref:5'-AMP-activated protein kinase subunit beta-2-like isoform X2 n=1 Tax=Lineus longissimus TaxID=88925 RepID=UPI002B4D7070
MGNTAGGAKRRLSGEDPSPSKEGSFDFLPSSPDPTGTSRKGLIYQPSLDDGNNVEFSQLRARCQDSQYEPILLQKGHTPEKPSKLPTVFKWTGGGKEVSLSGTFSGWKTKIPMVKSHGNFYTIVDLPQGEHQYKFYVDGEWVHDTNELTVPCGVRPREEALVSNDLGTQNNYISVKSSDFEVFEALAQDSIGSVSSSKLSGSPPGDYGQEVPVRRVDKHTGGPPLLPPHLLQVILNKDVPIHCEPTLLPEPNHVMLNHLYALSIKDGVMVLSATHRYKKKYVTTLLYKPI